MSSNFKEINLKKEYTTGIDNISRDFYYPVFSRTVLYKRAVGFFSTSALVKVTRGIQSLIKNNAKIQFIVSPKLSEEDIRQIELGYELREIAEKRLIEDYKAPSTDEQRSKIGLISHLIENGQLDIKVAFMKNTNKNSMFHVKYGIMKDAYGNTISYSGSLNDSITAYESNHENFDVFCSWENEESLERVITKDNNFDNLWNNSVKTLEILDFPKILKEKFDVIRNEINDESYLDETEYDFYDAAEETDKYKDVIELRDYQETAIKVWEHNNFNGIFEMATGTGKTLTAIAGAMYLREKINKLFIIIIVPYQHLVEQWVEDLIRVGIVPIVGYSAAEYANYDKKLKNVLLDFKNNISNFGCFITTIGSYRTVKVQKLVSELSNNVLFIADEAHNIGTASLRNKLHNYQYKLALSATLDRHNDIEGTEFLREYFGETCIEYDLEQAIKSKALCEYLYYPVINYLTFDELYEYKKITHEISRNLITDKNKKIKLSEKAKILLIKRSRIVAGAKNKITNLIGEFEKYKNDNGILIYCGATTVADDDLDEDIKQIDLVSKNIYEKFGINSTQFTSRENKFEREKIKENFINNDTQAIVAIRCLDEGVNIPSIKTAFILASSTNPKEYIQRRGRVLRPSSNKTVAEIFDFVTLPRNLKDVYLLSTEEQKSDLSLLKNEIKRMEEFSQLSNNKYITDDLIFKIKDAYIEISSLINKEGDEY